MSGEAVALNVVNKINNKLRFLDHKNSFLMPALRCLICNALIQPHFDHACSAWYQILTKKWKQNSNYSNVTTKTTNHPKPSKTTWNHLQSSPTTHPKISSATEPTHSKLENTQTGPKQFTSIWKHADTIKITCKGSVVKAFWILIKTIIMQ